MLNLTESDVGKHYITSAGKRAVITAWFGATLFPAMVAFVDKTGCGYRNWRTRADGRMYEDEHTHYDLIEEAQPMTTGDDMSAPCYKAYDGPSPKAFVTKDSGERATFATGMVRDTTAGKMRPDLVRDGPMFLRWVGLMTRGAVKYAARNWMKASTREEFDRFLESALRHCEIWYAWRMYGVNIEDPDNPTNEPLKEDHGAATFFNINGAEFVAGKLGMT